MACRTVVVHTRPHEASRTAAAALVDGFARHAVSATIVTDDRPRAADLAVMWSIRWPAVIAACQRDDRPYLVMERGCLGDQLSEVSLGFNGLKGHADYRNDDVGPERWEARFEGLLSPVWGRHDGVWLVVGQVPTDSAVAGVDVACWAQTAVDTLRALDPDREVVYRPHPVEIQPARPRGATWSTAPLAWDLGRAAAVVTYNSTTGVDAILAGVPVVAMDAGSMVWPIAAHAISADVLGMPEPDRLRWAWRAAYTQWTRGEMASGEAWAHLAAGPGDRWH